MDQYRYWNSAQQRQLGTVSDFAATAKIAINVLTRMRRHHPGKPVVQLCGPMSTGGAGSLEANMARFAAYIRAAEDAGHVVFNQIPFQDVIIRLTDHHAGGAYRMDILEEFYHPVFASGLVDVGMFLPDWESSVGACWERQRLTEMGIEVQDCPVEWAHRAAA